MGSKKVQNEHFSFLAYLEAIFCYHSNGKSPTRRPCGPGSLTQILFKASCIGINWKLSTPPIICSFNRSNSFELFL